MRNFIRSTAPFVLACFPQAFTDAFANRQLVRLECQFNPGSSISSVHASAALAWARKPNGGLEPGSFYLSDGKKCKVRKQLNKTIHPEGLLPGPWATYAGLIEPPIWPSDEWADEVLVKSKVQSVSKIQSRSNSSSSTLCMSNKSKMCMDIFSKKICRPRIHHSMKTARGLTHCY